MSYINTYDVLPKEIVEQIQEYVDGVKVDMVDGITDTNTIINRLSSGVKYTFKVYVSEKGDSANSLKAENNKTLIGETEFTTEGTKDTAAITAPEGTSVSLASAIYTCAQYMDRNFKGRCKSSWL